MKKYQIPSKARVCIDELSIVFYEIKIVIVKAQIDQQIRDRLIPDEMISDHHLSSLLSHFDH
jgi:hypothetical protein